MFNLPSRQLCVCIHKVLYIQGSRKVPDKVDKLHEQEAARDVATLWESSQWAGRTPARLVRGESSGTQGFGVCCDHEASQPGGSSVACIWKVPLWQTRVRSKSMQLYNMVDHVICYSVRLSYQNKGNPHAWEFFSVLDTHKLNNTELDRPYAIRNISGKSTSVYNKNAAVDLTAVNHDGLFRSMRWYGFGVLCHYWFKCNIVVQAISVKSGPLMPRLMMAFKYTAIYFLELKHNVFLSGLINIKSSLVLVMGKSPLPESMLTQVYVTIWHN